MPFLFSNEEIQSPPNRSKKQLQPLLPQPGLAAQCLDALLISFLPVDHNHLLKTPTAYPMVGSQPRIKEEIFIITARAATRPGKDLPSAHPNPHPPLRCLRRVSRPRKPCRTSSIASPNPIRHLKTRHPAPLPKPLLRHLQKRRQATLKSGGSSQKRSR